MRFHQLCRAKFSRNLSAVAGAIAMPLIGRSLSSDIQTAFQLGFLAMIGGCVGVYLHRCILTGIDCVRKGRSKSLLVWMCASGLVGGFVFLLCRALASGTEEGIFAWIVNGSPTRVFVRGCCLGAVGGILQAIELAPLLIDAASAKREQIPS